MSPPKLETSEKWAPHPALQAWSDSHQRRIGVVTRNGEVEHSLTGANKTNVDASDDASAPPPGHDARRRSGSAWLAVPHSNAAKLPTLLAQHEAITLLVLRSPSSHSGNCVMSYSRDPRRDGASVHKCGHDIGPAHADRVLLELYCRRGRIATDGFVARDANLASAPRRREYGRPRRW